AAAPDGVGAATAGGKLNPRRDPSIHLWDVRQPRPRLLSRLRGHDVFVTALAYSPSGTRLVSGDTNGAVLIWDLEKQERLFALEAHAEAVRAAAFTGDGKKVLTGGGDGSVIVWDAETGRESRRLPKHPDKVLGIAAGPGADEITTACGDGLL